MSKNSQDSGQRRLNDKTLDVKDPSAARTPLYKEVDNIDKRLKETDLVNNISLGQFHRTCCVIKNTCYLYDLHVMLTVH